MPKSPVLRHLIDPLVDYAFKRVFGTPASLHLLKHFLTAVIQPSSPIESLELLNPLNERDFADDKLTVVDVKAWDASGRIFQIEVQLLVKTALAARMLQNWATLYNAQLNKGDAFALRRSASELLWRRRTYVFARSWQNGTRTRREYVAPDHAAVRIRSLRRLWNR